MTKLLLIQGANMEWLGLREPEHYGTTSAAELDAMLQVEAKRRGITLDIRYTNIEGEAITWIYAAVRQGLDGLLFNPAGFIHTAFALRDCIRGTKVPAVEIHMTNIDKRGFHSATAEAAVGMVMGFGIDSYFVGLEAMMRHLAKAKDGQ